MLYLFFGEWGSNLSATTIGTIALLTTIALWAKFIRRGLERGMLVTTLGFFVTGILAYFFPYFPPKQIFPLYIPLICAIGLLVSMTAPNKDCRQNVNMPTV